MTTLRVERLPHAEGQAQPAYDTTGSAGQDLRAAVADLGLPDEAIRHVFVNGRRVALDYVPRPGDEVAIFPPLAGG
jgi:dUTP pyrophosphatase